MNREIRYKDIIDRGFNIEGAFDQVYFDTFGFNYQIITKNLTKRIYIQWDQDTRHCNVYRVNKQQDIKAKIEVRSLEHLDELLDFFLDN